MGIQIVQGLVPSFNDYVKADIYSLGKLIVYLVERPNERLASLVRRMTSLFPEDRPSLEKVMEELMLMWR